MKLPPCYGIIPARYASSRFPGKPLAPILGRPMLWHVHTRARLCPELARVVLATDDERIAQACAELDIPAVMTSGSHESGTDRVLEAATILGVPDEAVVVNIQGDEPALEPAMLSALVAPFVDETVRVTTLAKEISAERAASPNQVKVAIAKDGRALYFSRATIPFPRDNAQATYFGHIGLYAFRMETLRRFAELGPSPLECREKLEQLRLLEAGIPIRVVLTTFDSCGVDSPEDIQRAERILTEKTDASPYCA
ncbi:3-deoxy-manno-octulosonate cytidylyltransferase [Desulfocurvibacter africanus]|uniref:3-deoxy-manno-octulosonate cytidylyltransferase n=1 Tax=Desulfocurvibacter africanus subsp. africanus str. Walvis Bay TaxID=690850 RepID=F3YVA7_DESAF|nr:3-deoxy-manno-octulosonate cytidylyltransferase [Desulfocurvibacter africanus]EGJ48499.1 3-deoxy-manno-octulosonate cytidylyltransferase [Desulfocurvibacter africanus subsp. africanus str. Walvis Bay]